jgi:acid phosphatase (class A)
MRYGLKLIALALLLPVCGHAADWVIPHTTYYISAEQQKFPDFPPPPSAGSRAERKDFAALEDWQKRRTAEQCAKANAVARASYGDFFGDISPFPAPLPPEAAAIFKRVQGETDGVAADIKDMFKRQRPFHTDKALDPCLGRIGGLAYPSGHATISRLFALMLSDLVPARKKEFFARADAAALDRVIGGVHHPSDIEAGKKLAEMLYRRYRKSPVFMADMKTLAGLLAAEPAAAK